MLWKQELWITQSFQGEAVLQKGGLGECAFTPPFRGEGTSALCFCPS